MGISRLLLLRSACPIAKESQEKKRDLKIYIYQRKEKWIKKKKKWTNKRNSMQKEKKMISKRSKKRPKTKIKRKKEKKDKEEA